VYGLTGLPGSGKSELGRVLKDHGHPLIRMGDMVWDHVRELGLELTSMNVGRIAHERREREGPDIWARVTARSIHDLTKDDPQNLVFIDGVRSIQEADHFRETLENFRIVAVHTSPKTRYDRIMARKRIDDTLSYESFIEREQRELSWGIAKVIVLADIMVVNDGTKEELKESALALFTH